jgi:hypothetical protein
MVVRLVRLVAGLSRSAGESPGPTPEDVMVGKMDRTMRRLVIFSIPAAIDA